MRFADIEIPFIFFGNKCYYDQWKKNLCDDIAGVVAAFCVLFQATKLLKMGRKRAMLYGLFGVGVAILLTGFFSTLLEQEDD